MKQICAEQLTISDQCLHVEINILVGNTCVRQRGYPHFLLFTVQLVQRDRRHFSIVTITLTGFRFLQYIHFVPSVG